MDRIASPKMARRLWRSSLRITVLVAGLTVAVCLGVVGTGGDAALGDNRQHALAQATILTPAEFPNPQTAPTDADAGIEVRTAVTREAPLPVIALDPRQSAPGEVVTVRGAHWPANEEIRLTLSEFPEHEQILNVDGEHYLRSTTADAMGEFLTEIRVPDGQAWESAHRALVIAFTADLAVNAVQDLSLLGGSRTPDVIQPIASGSPQPTPERVVAVVMVKGDSSAIRLSTDRDARSVPFSYPQNGLFLAASLVIALGAAVSSRWFAPGSHRGELRNRSTVWIHWKQNSMSWLNIWTASRDGVQEQLSLVDATLKEAVLNMNDSKELLALKLDKFRREDVAQKLERLEALDRRQRQFWDGLDVSWMSTATAPAYCANLQTSCTKARSRSRRLNRTKTTTDRWSLRQVHDGHVAYPRSTPVSFPRRVCQLSNSNPPIFPSTAQ